VTVKEDAPNFLHPGKRAIILGVLEIEDEKLANKLQYGIGNWGC